MKHATSRRNLLLFAAIFLYNTNTALPPRIRQEKFSVAVQSTWKELDSKPERISQCGGKQVLIGTLTFKKKYKEPITLNSLQLRWDGPDLENISCSLYRKDHNNELVPIQHNLICDSTWNKTEKMVILTFNTKQHIGVENTYCLVLHLSPELESTIKGATTEGKSLHFTLVPDSLPESFKPYAQAKAITIC